MWFRVLQLLRLAIFLFRMYRVANSQVIERLQHSGTVTDAEPLASASLDDLKQPLSDHD